MKLKQTSSLPWYNRRAVAFAFAAAALALVWPVALRAIDTGSLQQYVFVTLLLIVAVHRLATGLRRNSNTTHEQKR